LTNTVKKLFPNFLNIFYKKTLLFIKIHGIILFVDDMGG